MIKAPDLNFILARSAELQDRLTSFLGLTLNDTVPRTRISRVMCGISFEHCESIKLLTSAGSFSSSVSLMRLQYEAAVRALWIHFAAEDGFVEKMAASLSKESERRASKLPMVGTMLENLESKAPPEALALLQDFGEHQWNPLNSFVDGGIHAIHRHGTGYPVALLIDVLKSSTGLSMMAAMLLVILHGGVNQRGRLTAIQSEFIDCLPSLKHPPDINS